jgi:hypothetical protein
MSSFTPAAAMFYTDIQTLRGLDRPVDYGSGIEYADGILESLFPDQDVGLQIGLWLNGTAGCDDINSGALAGNVDKLIQYLSTTKASKVFLRVGYEFDNPSFGYNNPTSYKKAFVHLVNECRRLPDCARKVEFVWHSWAARRQGNLEDYYPGNQFVDWIGVSIFDHFFPWSQGEGRPEDIIQVLEFAKARDKPTMIAESTPFGGIDMDLTITQPYDMEDPWDRWFQPTLDLINEYDIGMWSYINCDWQSQPMWHDVGFGETRLSTNKMVMQKWQEKVLHGDRPFLMGGSLLECTDQHVEITMGELWIAAPSPRKLDFQKSRWDSAFGLLIFSACSIVLYFWKRARPITPRRELEERRETQELMSMIRYGSIATTDYML